MRKIRKGFHIAFITAVAAALVCIFTIGALAYTTPSYNVDITVNEDYSFDYKEDITVNFEYSQHGIFRNIPMDSTYRIRKIRVGGDYEYEVSRTSGNKLIKIGSADTYVTGEHTYPIRYTLVGVKDNDPKHDYMYIDVLPTGWDSAIESARVTIHLPENFKWDDISYYTGRYGDDAEQYGHWTYNEKTHTISYSGKNLPYGVGATVKAKLPEGTWKDPISLEWAIKAAGLLALAAVAAMLAMRLTVGRNAKVIQPVEFYAPEGLSPMELGYVIDGKVDRADITSNFFYLASKGYISIEEYKKKKFKFSRLAVPDGEATAVKRFYKGIFGAHAFDDIATTDEKHNKMFSGSMGGRMSTAYEAIPKLVEDRFQGDRKLFTRESKTADLVSKLIFFVTIVVVSIFRKIYTGEIYVDGLPAFVFPVIGAVLLLIVLIKLTDVYYHRLSRRGYGTTWRVLVWLAVYFVMSFIFTMFNGFDSELGAGSDRLGLLLVLFLSATPVVLLGMRTRGAYSNELYGRVLGFRNFIRTAELDKLNALVEENPSYFYDVLPYAYVFGLTDKWAKKFEDIAIEEPSWYTPYGYEGRGFVFDAHMCSHMCSSVSSSVESSINAVDSGGGHVFSGGSGGGGFSGGGFSGGGFGGGGGGAW